MTPKDTPDAEIPAAEIPDEGNICFADPAAGTLPLDPHTGRALVHGLMVEGATWRADGHIETIRAIERRAAERERRQRRTRPRTFMLSD
ncbi:MAG: hypothetical protein AAFU72_08720 [Pseudomonadota bacterium]